MKTEEVQRNLEIKSIEVNLFLEGIFQKYGYDFRQYAMSSMQRRIDGLLIRFGFSEPLTLLQQILHSDELFQKVLPYLTVGTTEMFRDPEFFRGLREQVIPTLKTYPLINIWIAGTSTGEELYSLTILLKEEGLLERSVIFATDINRLALRSAQEGIYPLEQLAKFEKNYIASGGKAKFDSYITQAYDSFKMDSELKTNIVFSEHNLAVDSVFTECHLILCRNVLIYFNKELQDRVLQLLSASLHYQGYLCLGSKEALRFSKVAQIFEPLDERWRIFRKVGRTTTRRHLGDA